MLKPPVVPITRVRLFASARVLVAWMLVGAATSTSSLAAPTTAWTTHSGGGSVDAAFFSSCGPTPVMLDAAGNSMLGRVYGGSLLSIVKFSPSGELLWRTDESAPQYLPCLAALDAAGDIYVARFIRHLDSTSTKLVTVKYSGSDGVPLWSVESTTIRPTEIGSMAVDAQGDVLILVRGTMPGQLVSLIVKYHGATGEPAWPEHPNGERLDSYVYRMLALDGQGDAVVASTTRAAKLAGASGATLWTADVPQSGVPTFGSNDHVPNGLVIDGAGDVFVLKGEQTGEVVLTPTMSRLTRDYVTVKLSGATGEPMWTARYDAFDLNDDVPVAIALDSAGNAFVHGSSSVGGIDQADLDFATLKLDAATGMPAWSAFHNGAHRYDGPANDRDGATAIAVDAAGNVFVTGSSTNLAGDEDVLTRKYSGITGHPLWAGLPDFASRHDGPVGGFDAAIGLAIGANGNVFVAAHEEGLENDDQVLLHLDGMTGSMLWSARSEPTVARSERLYDLHTHTTKVDAAGNTFVAGATFNGLCDEWLLMKVAPDGSRLWSRGFSSPRKAYLHPCGVPLDLVLDADGDIFVTGQLSGSIATAKFSGIDGAPLWTGLPDGIAWHLPRWDLFGRQNQAGWRLAIDSQGDVVMAAAWYPNPTMSTSFLYVVKYDGDTGQKIWNGQHGESDFYYSHRVNPTGLAVDAQDNVVVTADTPDPWWQPRIVTIKYDGTSGMPISVANFPCSGPVLAIDSSQDVIIACTGREGSSGPEGFATLKYSGATGQPVWTERADGSIRYNSPDGTSARVGAIAVDHRNHIYVSGESTAANGETYWATIKYASADGASMWARGAVRQHRPQLENARMTLSLLDHRAFVLSGQQMVPYFNPPRGLARGGFSVHNARTGTLLHTETLPIGTTLGTAVFAPDEDLRVTGTADDADEDSTVYVRRTSGLALPVFGSGFELRE
jgi:hypothetical protein